MAKTAKTWREVREAAVDDGPLDEGRIENAKARFLNEARAHELREIRGAYGLNQTALAERLHVSQSRVSRIERGDLDRTEVATLRAYVRALGGELEVTARFGDKRIPLE